MWIRVASPPVCRQSWMKLSTSWMTATYLLPERTVIPHSSPNRSELERFSVYYFHDSTPATAMAGGLLFSGCPFKYGKMRSWTQGWTDKYLSMQQNSHHYGWVLLLLHALSRHQYFHEVRMHLTRTNSCCMLLVSKGSSENVWIWFSRLFQRS